MSLDKLTAEFLTRQGIQAYLTGGSARDRLLGRASRDVDVTVVGDASNLARILANELNAAYYQLDEEFNVARVLVTLPDGTRTNIDLAQLRGETVQDDLMTRDFAINAMALPLANGQWLASIDAVVDPFGGMVDLTVSQVRAISDKIFQSDPVRLLRAPRVAATLGMTIDPGTITMIERDADLLGRGSIERIRDELIKILSLKDAKQNLLLLDELGLLPRLMPEIALTRDCTQSPPHIFDVYMHSLNTVAAIERAQEENYSGIADGKYSIQLETHFAQEPVSEHPQWMLLRLAALLHDVGKPATRTVEPDGRIRFLGHEEAGAAMAEAIVSRLRFSNDEVALIKTIVMEHLRPLQLSQNAPISNRAVYRYFRDIGVAGADVCIHAWADQQAKGGQNDNDDRALQSAIERLFSAFYDKESQVVAPAPLVNGRDVMSVLDIKPGKRVGEVLDAVREAQVEGQVHDRAEALEWIRGYRDKSMQD